jgi:hypothetical protein
MKKEVASQQPHSELSKEVVKSKRKLIASVVCATMACVAIAIIGNLNGEDEAWYSSILGLIAAGITFILSLQVILRQKLTALMPRLYGSLGVGLGLWLAAEAIWAYYELAAGIETPFPSIADIFWLAGYTPFFHFLYGINKHFLGLKKSMTLPLLLISLLAFAFLGNILLSIYQSADLSTQDGILPYIVGSAYPIADMFLVVPAIAAFIQMRKGKLTFTPWVLIVLATIVFIIGDIGFAYSTSITELSDTVWFWNPLYNLGYIAIASALFWHKSFFTIDEKKLQKAWQEKNR